MATPHFVSDDISCSSDSGSPDSMSSIETKHDCFEFSDASNDDTEETPNTSPEASQIPEPRDLLDMVRTKLFQFKIY